MQGHAFSTLKIVSLLAQGWLYIHQLENWQGPTSMAYSLLLDSNEQLFLVQFHLGSCACILRNL